MTTFLDTSFSYCVPLSAAHILSCLASCSESPISHRLVGFFSFRKTNDRRNSYLLEAFLRISHEAARVRACIDPCDGTEVPITHLLSEEFRALELNKHVQTDLFNIALPN